MHRFGVRILPGISLLGRLQKSGWYQSSIQDGGSYHTFYREAPSVGMGVELRFFGACVGYSDETDVTVCDAVFYHSGTMERGSCVYDSPSDENTFALGAVPPRYYSEIVLQLEQATAPSTNINPDWEKERHW